MARQRRRISLGQQPDEGPPSSPEPRPFVHPEPEATAAPASDDDGTIAESEAEAMAKPVRPSIERHPLFWFALGALTVGILVLLGLLVLGTGAPRPTPTPTRLPPTHSIPTPAPNVAATMTAYVELIESVPRISVEETKRKLDAGEVVLVDVRSKLSYDERHIKGAINIPEVETQRRLSEFPRDKDIVLYCA